ncbi:MAG: SOS response-associated peptidase [Flavobacteriaceae bacterium]
MCGRFKLTTPPDKLRSYFNYAEQPNFPPRYNIAPTQPIAVVRAGVEPGARHFALLRWGLIPPWVKDVAKFPLIINARAEEAAGKPAFRAALRRRRCLIPADGFYEWQAPAGTGGRKVPYLIYRADGGPFAFGGLWEHFIDTHGNEIETAAILTTDANADLAPIHARCPVVIGDGYFSRWLDHADERVESIADLLRPPPDGFFSAYAVSTLVNSVANDNASLVEPAGGEPIPPQRREKPAEDEAPPRQLKLF